jgi:hypothetical protein
MRYLALVVLLVASVSDASKYRRFRARNPTVTSNTSLVFHLAIPSSPGGTMTDLRGAPITYSRSGARTCQTDSSTYVDLTDDQACTVNGAVLIEGASTNLMTQSEAYSGWTKTNTAITTDYAAAPDGIMSADLITPTFTGGYAESPPVSQTGTRISGSIWARTDGADSDFLLELVNGGSGVTLCSSSVTVSSTYQRISCSSTSATNAATYFLRVTPSQSGVTPVVVVGSQVESVAAPTSYIRTAGSTGTRNADVLSFVTPASWPTTTGCFSATFKGVGSNTGSQTVAVNADGINYFLNSFGSSSQNGWAVGIGNADKLLIDHRISNASTQYTLTASPTWAADTSYDVKVTWSGASTSTIYRNSVALSAAGSLTTATSNKATVYIGNRADNARMAWGWLSAIKVGTTLTACD